jgi:transglutaminase-like putative cysteine protease
MSKRKFILVFLACFCTLVGIAAPKANFGPAPGWIIPVKQSGVQPNLREVNDGYYVKLFDEQVCVEENAVYDHVIRHIFSDAGVQGASSISINFNPAYEQVTVHNIAIWRDGKAINKLDPKAFKIIANEEDLYRFLYNGNYSAYLILEDVRKDDQIEYSYTIKGRNPIFNNKYFTSFIFQGSDPTTQIHYALLAPKNRVFDFKYFNNAPKPTVKDIRGRAVYEWDLTNVPGTENTGNVPRWYNPYPYVQVSEYRSWAEISNWAYGINQPQSHLKGALAQRVEKVKGEYKDDQPKLLRALTEIAENEIRYMGVEIGEYSHKANSPEKVYDQRYGDCKDKSLLLTSMLRSAGIEADIALVNANKSKIGDYLPSPSAFNHAIVCAHTKNGDVWIDPTSSYQGGGGDKLYCPSYGKALLLGANTSALVTMPQPTGGTIKYTEYYAVKDEHSPVELTINTMYEKDEADDMRASFASQSKHDLEKNYLDYYTKVYPRIKSADTLVINDEKESNKLETVERYTIDDFFSFDSANQNYLGSFYAYMIRDVLPNVKNNKDHPIAITYPYSLRHQVRVTAPINWQMEATTKNITRDAYVFGHSISVEGNTLIISYDLSFLKDHIAPSEIAQYEKDRKAITEDYLSFAFNYGQKGANTSGISWIAVFAAILLLGGCAYAAVRIYRMQSHGYALRHERTDDRRMAHFTAPGAGGYCNTHDLQPFHH